LIGNKRKNKENAEILSNKDQEKELSEPIEVINYSYLDLDDLHKIVSPPSELNDTEYNKKSNEKQNKSNRKSERAKKDKNNLFQFINCHQCKKIDNSMNMLVCTNSDCRESFCYNCVKKYFPKKFGGIQ